MSDIEPRIEVPAENDDVDVVVCELARHNIGFMVAGGENEEDESVFLVFRL